MRLALGVAVALVSAAAGAVGLGPLSKSGITDGAGKAFYLTLSNPYPTIERFHANGLMLDSELDPGRIIIFPSHVALGPQAHRQLLVIVRGLSPGERFTFRVCAARDPKPEETVYARVCSTLTAHRLPART